MIFKEAFELMKQGAKVRNKRRIQQITGYIETSAGRTERGADA